MFIATAVEDLKELFTNNLPQKGKSDFVVIVMLPRSITWPEAGCLFSARVTFAAACKNHGINLL